jgi:hypothetical protein
MSTKTVWILGSGFSKSLGGPLLDELFSHKAQVELVHTHQSLADEFSLACTTYRKGREAGLWDHAEAYLEYLDTAVRTEVGSARRSSVAHIGGGTDIDALSRAAKMTVAAQCHFTHDADVSEERWEPYLKWARQLNGDHTIITFNYDLVLETLASQNTRISVPALDEVDLDSLPKGNAKVYKLHGSLDWIEDGGCLRRLDEPFDAYIKRADQLAIAAPGPAKRERVEGAFRWLWDTALKELAEAQTVIFVGYRFPPSDSDARSRLLDALGKGQVPQYGRVAVGIVLGPDTRSTDNIRLQKMVHHTLQSKGYGRHSGETPPWGTFRLGAAPLWTEDFLSVVSVDALSWAFTE